MRIVYSYEFGTAWYNCPTYSVTTAKRIATRMISDTKYKAFASHKMWKHIPYECRDVRIVSDDGTVLDKGSIVYDSFRSRLAWI